MGSWKYEWVALASMVAFSCGGDDDGSDRALDAGSVDSGRDTTPTGSRGGRDDGPLLEGGAPSDSGSDAGVRSPEAGARVPGSLLRDELTAAQESVICGEMAAATGNVAKNARFAVCAGAALLVAQQRPGSCEEIRSRCLMDDEDVDVDFSDALDCDDRDSETKESCPGVTVAQVEACTASHQARAIRFASFSCKSSAIEVEQAIDEAGTLSPECRLLAERCTEVSRSSQ